MTAELRRGAILVDWGTTNLRAYLTDGSGAVVGQRSSDQGILKSAGRFPEAFREIAGSWREKDPTLPIVMSGMIGSRQGWVEAPYLDCPADLNALNRGAVTVPGLADAVILPGIAYLGPEGHRDVMRGEETKILGALATMKGDSAVLCLPGTHCKWAEVERGRLVRFATAMTGELFQVMREHSILGKLMNEGDPGHEEATFARGLMRAGQGGGLLHHLFSVRAEGLFGTVPPRSAASYLSGILIGHEVSAMTALFRTDQVVLVASSPQAEPYEAAIGHAGLRLTRIAADEAVLAGLWRAAEALQ